MSYLSRRAAGEVYAHSFLKTKKKHGTLTICNKLCYFYLNCLLSCQTLATPIAGVHVNKLLLVLITRQDAQTVDGGPGGVIQEKSYKITNAALDRK